MYTDEIPAEDINEYAAAIDDNPTEYVYDGEGNRITEVSTGIEHMLAGNVVSTRYYSLDGVRQPSPSKGVSIKQVVYSDGHSQTFKVLMR